MKHVLACIQCSQKYKADDIRYRCDCGGLLEIELNIPKSVDYKSLFNDRLKKNEHTTRSGVWRYKELIVQIEDKYIITKPEGNTNLYNAGKNEKNGLKNIGEYANSDYLLLKHEGENPTGSFKDRGMTVGISMAKKRNIKAAACASTGNTSSSLASYAALAGLRCFVFLPKGKISPSKLTQSIAYGAINIQIDGDFDKAMKLVEKICIEHNIYLLNSINPYRIEGQKSILFELLQDRNWKIPDWIVLPGGNLGNTSALGKGLHELKELNIITKLPRIAVIQAEGANPFYQSFKDGFKKKYTLKAETVASAIRIGNPVSFDKAKRTIEETHGVVECVSDKEILDTKAIIDRSGIGCEPASASTIAGLKKLIKKKIIKTDDDVVGILTGHILKDPMVTMEYHLRKNTFANKVHEETEKTVGNKIKNLLRG